MNVAGYLFVLISGALSLPCLALTPAYGESVDEQMAALFSEYNSPGLPGATVAVMRSGKTLFKHAYGTANLKTGAPTETDMAFHLASAGKEMTALAILMLQQQGKLSVDAPVSRYLPQFRGWGGRITVKNLLYHTSGLPDYYENIEETFARPTNAQALRFLSALHRLDFQPGSKTEYSNSGFDTLGTLVEKVSRQKFTDFMREQIFSPAGMTNTFAYDRSVLQRSKVAVGYSKTGGELYEDNTSPLNNLHGSGSIYTTVEDMVKYDEALFGYRFVTEATLSKAFRSGRLNNGRTLNYGYGWELGNDDTLNERYYGHSGEWMGFSSYYLHYPSSGLSVIVLINFSDGDPETLAFSAAAIAAGAGL